MINAEMQTVQVITYSGVDTYGQARQYSSTRAVKMCIKPYKQTETSDIRFINVEQIGLTLDTGITDANSIQIGSTIYNVVSVLPTNRYYQVLMRKK